MRVQLVALVAAALAPCALGIPQLLECANDTATRLRLGGPAIMQGVKACPLQCPVALAKQVAENGNVKISVTTSADGIGFVVRVSDGAGKLSSTNANVSSHCDGQMYSLGQQGVPAGTYDFELAPANTFNLADLVVTVGFVKSFSTVQLVADPPLPAAKVYRCISNQCQVSATGIDLDTCKALCSGEQITV